MSIRVRVDVDLDARIALARVAFTPPELEPMEELVLAAAADSESD